MTDDDLGVIDDYDDSEVVFTSNQLTYEKFIEINSEFKDNPKLFQEKNRLEYLNFSSFESSIDSEHVRTLVDQFDNVYLLCNSGNLYALPDNLDQLFTPSTLLARINPIYFNEKDIEELDKHDLIAVSDVDLGGIGISDIDKLEFKLDIENSTETQKFYTDKNGETYYIDQYGNLFSYKQDASGSYNTEFIFFCGKSFFQDPTLLVKVKLNEELDAALHSLMDLDLQINDDVYEADKIFYIDQNDFDYLLDRQGNFFKRHYYDDDSFDDYLIARLDPEYFNLSFRLTNLDIRRIFLDESYNETNFDITSQAFKIYELFMSILDRNFKDEVVRFVEDNFELINTKYYSQNSVIFIAKLIEYKVPNEQINEFFKVSYDNYQADLKYRTINETIDETDMEENPEEFTLYEMISSDYLAKKEKLQKQEDDLFYELSEQYKLFE